MRVSEIVCDNTYDRLMLDRAVEFETDVMRFLPEREATADELKGIALVLEKYKCDESRMFNALAELRANAERVTAGSV